MKFLKQSSRKNPKVSLILLDWSVRESFHLLHYLNQQTVDRDLFEVVLIEYYSTVSEAATKFADQIDTWLLLEMPTDCYYHKHLMYNVGIVFSHGEISVICDSDAMVKDSFIETIITEFETDPNIVLHIDQFRNNRRDFYPFNYPSFDEVIGPGCINYVDGVTEGVVETEDPIHKRNYGACLCAARKDLLAIGGADEHFGYVGYICGPYDMTFRLINLGRREIWHRSEFMYHTWHPGQAGVDNFMGPHDGMNMSTVALEALRTRRIHPYLENKAIQTLRLNNENPIDFLIKNVIDADYAELFNKNNLHQLEQLQHAKGHKQLVSSCLGYKILNNKGVYEVFLLDKKLFEAESLEQIERLIRSSISKRLLVKYKILYFTNLFIVSLLFLKILVKKVMTKLLRPVKRALIPMFIKIGGIFKLIQYRKRQSKVLQGSIKASIDSLTTGLLQFKKLHGDFSPSSALLIDSKLTAAYLKCLMNLKLLPVMEIVVLKSVEEIKHYFNSFGENEDDSKRLIIGSSLYNKHYSYLSCTPLGRLVIVL